MSYDTVAGGLTSAYATTMRQQADVRALADGVEDVGYHLARVTRGSGQRRVRRFLARYAGSVKKLRDAERLLGEAADGLAEYASTIGVDFPVALLDDAPATAEPVRAGDTAEFVLLGEVGKADEPPR